jgi:signal transduction histidine kinase
LDLATQDTLFATVRELLTNVVRHAGADHVQVCIERAPAGLRATVADDGRGMPHHRLEEVVSGKRGFGLYSAQRRVASLGGTLRLSTPENGGLRAEIHLPVPGGEAPGHDEPEDPSHDH